MQASKVIILPETRAKLSNPVLSPIKRRQLREELIKESIRKAVGGVRTKQELIAAAGFNPDGKSGDYVNGLTLLNSMVKRGIISHNPTSKFKKSWVILTEVKITPTPKKIAEGVVNSEPTLVLQEQKALDKATLLDMAKDFSWRENSDSLRDFIAYMQNTVK